MRFADEDSGREIDNDDTALKCNFVEGWPEIDAQCDGPPRLKHINDSRQRGARLPFLSPFNVNQGGRTLFTRAVLSPFTASKSQTFTIHHFCVTVKED